MDLQYRKYGWTKLRNKTSIANASFWDIEFETNIVATHHQILADSLRSEDP
jgi:hypothetical protein